MNSGQQIIDQELAQFGWVESIAKNAITDFKSPKSKIEEEISSEKNTHLTDIAICHLIFYVIGCYSLFLYIVIDLAFGSFVKNILTTIIKFIQKK